MLARVGKGRYWLASLAFLPLSLLAQSGGPYAIEQWTLDAGGGASSGGTYQLDGTIGQTDAGPAPSGEMTGANYGLRGGFWTEASDAVSDRIFANGFQSVP